MLVAEIMLVRFTSAYERIVAAMGVACSIPAAVYHGSDGANWLRLLRKAVCVGKAREFRLSVRVRSLLHGQFSCAVQGQQ
jgi:hypothetical protein